MVARIRVALCQLDTTVGALASNADKVVEYLARAELAGADVAVFPELAITGYPPEDLLVEPAFVSGSMELLGKVASSTGRCAAVVGYVEEDGDLYNSAAVCAQGGVHGTWRKQLLPNYGVFDEHRWFAPGPDPSVLFEIGGVRVGVTICEDVWSPTGPIAKLASGGAELIVTLNASPYRAGVVAERERMLATRAADFSCALAYVNLVGGQDELVYDGGSMVFDHDGTLVARAPQFEEALVCCDLDIRPVYRKRLLDPRGYTVSGQLPVVAVSGPDPGGAVSPVMEPPVAPVLSRDEEVYRALVLGTRDYVEKNGFGHVLVALSGGIDSSLVAAIATDALGATRVHGVSMPSRYSSEGSVVDAKALADSLGIELRSVPIEPVHEAFLGLLEPQYDSRAPGLAGENLQARIRGVVLMALSNRFGWLVLTTGNKSELAVGYATLYGDMAGGFAVIKDVPKTLVYELCTYRNSVGPRSVIPQAVIDKPPSAELAPGQRDDQSLPDYGALDAIIEGYVEADLTVTDLVAAGHDATVVRRVIDLVDHAEYKRRQAPPGPRVTSRGFGKDRRMPITNAFRASEGSTPASLAGDVAGRR